MNRYEVGDRVRITGTFTDTAGSPANPSTVVVYVLKRDGATWTYSAPTNPATGTWYADHDVTQEGTYDYRVVGTGSIIAAGEGTFKVEDSYFF